MSKIGDIVLFVLLGILILLFILAMIFPFLLEARLNKEYGRRAARTRNEQSHARNSGPNEHLPTSHTVHLDVPLDIRQNDRRVTTVQGSHDPYDSKHTYMCDYPDSWMGDGGSCPHS
jgi:hypothetical protein